MTFIFSTPYKQLYSALYFDRPVLLPRLSVPNLWDSLDSGGRRPVRAEVAADGLALGDGRFHGWDGPLLLPCGPRQLRIRMRHLRQSGTAGGDWMAASGLPGILHILLFSG